MMEPVLNHDDYTIVWIAILDIEVEAAMASLQEEHRGGFPTIRQDDYIYIAGQVENHNVVIAKPPAGQQYGTATSASLVSHVKSRFKNVWFALLVGVAAGLPDYDMTSKQARDIRLGDVLVCVPNKYCPGVVHFDFGSDTGDVFVSQSRQTAPPKQVLSAVSSLRHKISRPYRNGNQLAQMLEELQWNAHMKWNEDGKFAYPGQDKDELFIRDASTATQSQDKKLERPRRDSNEVTQVWYGSIGSSNTLMRNAVRKDELRVKHDLIGLEMEAAGVMNTLPTGVIKGVCDYADSHKSDTWQPYAAAVAAVYARALLRQIRVLPNRTNQISSSVRRELEDLRDHSHFLKTTSQRYRHYMTKSGMLIYSLLWDMISRNRSHVSLQELTSYVQEDVVPHGIVLKFWQRFGGQDEKFGRSLVMAVFFMIHLEHLNREVVGKEEAQHYRADDEYNDCFYLMDEWEACPDACGLEWNFTASLYGFCRTAHAGTTFDRKCLVHRRYLEKKIAGTTNEFGKQYKTYLTPNETKESEKLRRACSNQWRQRLSRHAYTNVRLA